MNRIMPSTVQAWVTHAVEIGRSPRSIGKYHTMLHSVFARAVRDRLIAFNPCAATELPKIVLRKGRILTPAEFERLIAEIPARFTVMVLTAIETGLRWGELAALRPEHGDFLGRTITVQGTTGVINVTGNQFRSAMNAGMPSSRDLISTKFSFSGPPPPPWRRR